MQRGVVALGFAATMTVLSLSSCATWFVLESRNRGDVFDEASRGITPLDLTDVRSRLDDRIHQAFPPGTPLSDVTRHIEDAGGACSNSSRGWAKPGFERTICSYERDIYFTRQMFFMGEPDFWLTHNDWTVNIAHSDGLVGWHVVEGQATAESLSRQDYLDGLDRQRAEEEAFHRTALEN